MFQTVTRVPNPGLVRDLPDGHGTLAAHAPSSVPERDSAVSRRIVETGNRIRDERPERAEYLHSILCHVGLPRRRSECRTFERRNGNASILLEAGRLFDGRHWVDHPLPYGVIPRLVMVHLSSEAVRTRQRTVEIGDSIRQFLLALGLSTSGGKRGAYRALKIQVEALAACRMTIGLFRESRAVTVDAKPIQRFEAWLHTDGGQRSSWPGTMELSHEFFEALTGHAVPLDPRALAALKHSALAIDIYTWLAHRLCRVRAAGGTMLSWGNLRHQFGQEYGTSRNFKHEFRRALRQALTVYPDARVEAVVGGIVLFPSRPPLSRTNLLFALP